MSETAELTLADLLDELIEREKRRAADELMCVINPASNPLWPDAEQEGSDIRQTILRRFDQRADSVQLLDDDHAELILGELRVFGMLLTPYRDPKNLPDHDEWQRQRIDAIKLIIGLGVLALSDATPAAPSGDA